ncbi:MAG: leucine-rich repeat domain-containing protein, partial [Planctomycetales bacterium]|nr:leucine-rich repeat domain-containing protein [Planctomycetales bacterium]
LQTNRRLGVVADLYDAEGRRIAGGAAASSIIDMRSVPAGQYHLRVYDPFAAAPAWNPENHRLYDPAYNPVVNRGELAIGIEIEAPKVGEADARTDRDELRGSGGPDRLEGGAYYDRLFGELDVDSFVAEPLEIRDKDFGGAESTDVPGEDLGYLVATPDDFNVTFEDPILELAVAKELGLAVPDASGGIRLSRPLRATDLTSLVQLYADPVSLGRLTPRHTVNSSSLGAFTDLSLTQMPTGTRLTLYPGNSAPGVTAIVTNFNESTKTVNYRLTGAAFTPTPQDTYQFAEYILANSYDTVGNVISALSGLEYATNLEYLGIAKQQISSLSNVEPGIRLLREEQGELGLRSLRFIDADGNPLQTDVNEAYPPTDIGPLHVLSRLSKLEYVSIDSLSGATSVNANGHDGNTYYDLSFTDNLDQLRWLSARDNQITTYQDVFLESSHTGGQTPFAWYSLDEINGASIRNIEQTRPVRARTTFVAEDFEAFTSGQSLDGIGGWSSTSELLPEDRNRVRIEQSDANRYVAAVGPSTRQSVGNLGFLRNIPLKMSDQQQLKLTFRAKTVSNSHNSGMGMVFSETTSVWWTTDRTADGDSTRTSWILEWRPNGAVNNVVTGVIQARDEWGSFEIIVDLEEFEIYGRYNVGNGWKTTDRLPIDPSDVASFIGLNVFQDFRGANTGVDLDDIEFSTIEKLKPGQTSSAIVFEGVRSTSDASPSPGSTNQNLGSFAFDGVSGHVAIPLRVETDLWDFTQESLAASLWFRTSSESGGIFSINPDAKKPAIDKSALNVYLDDKYLMIQGGQESPLPVLGKPVADGEWHHILLFYSPVSVAGRSGSYRLYLDGEPLYTRESFEFPAGPAEYRFAQIGYAQTPDDGGAWFDGQIDEVRLYRGPASNLPDSQIAILSQPWQSDQRGVTALADKQSLQFLDLSNNQISDVSPLTTLENLRWLDMTNNMVSSIDAIAGQWIIDNGDAGYAETGSAWTTGNRPNAFGADYRIVASSNGEATATYRFSNLPVIIDANGKPTIEYELQVAWPEHESRTSAAQWRIVDVASVEPIKIPFVNVEDQEKLVEEDVSDTLAEAYSLGTLVVGDQPRLQIRSELGDSTHADFDVDLYEFSVEAGTTLILETHALETFATDTVLRLFDSSGMELAKDDQSGLGYLSELIYTFENPGKYYVGVSGYLNDNYDPKTGSGATSGNLGPYELTLRLAQPDQYVVGKLDSGIFPIAIQNILEERAFGLSTDLTTVHEELPGQSWRLDDGNIAVEIKLVGDNDARQLQFTKMTSALYTRNQQTAPRGEALGWESLTTLTPSADGTATVTLSDRGLETYLSQGLSNDEAERQSLIYGNLAADAVRLVRVVLPNLEVANFAGNPLNESAHSMIGGQLQGRYSNNTDTAVVEGFSFDSNDVAPTIEQIDLQTFNNSMFLPTTVNGKNDGFDILRPNSLNVDPKADRGRTIEIVSTETSVQVRLIDGEAIEGEFGWFGDHNGGWLYDQRYYSTFDRQDGIATMYIEGDLHIAADTIEIKGNVP